LKPEVVVSDDPAGAAAERLAAAAGGHIALTGGSTPRTAYQRLAAMDLDWSTTTFWFGDDRCVPPDHEHSNYRMAR
jgi:6-phosphogluconolactonase